MHSNRAMQSAYNKGVAARVAGKPETSNPYDDHRTHTGSVTFSRAFLRAWAAGWKANHQSGTVGGIREGGD